MSLNEDIHPETLSQRRALLERWMLIFLIKLIEGSQLSGGVAMSRFLGSVPCGFSTRLGEWGRRGPLVHDGREESVKCSEDVTKLHL